MLKQLMAVSSIPYQAVYSLYFKFPNVIVTPHIAGSSGNEVVLMSNYMYEEAIRVLHNEKCKYEINLELFKVLA